MALVAQSGIGPLGRNGKPGQRTDHFDTYSVSDCRDVTTKLVQARRRFNPMLYQIQPREIKHPVIQKQTVINDKPAGGVYACYLQTHAHVSPHLMARQIIDSADTFDKPNHNNQMGLPAFKDPEKLMNEDDVFFDIYNASTGLKTVKFWKFAATLSLSQYGKIPKPICHMRMITITTENSNALFLVPRLLSQMPTVRESPILPIFGNTQSKSNSSTPTSTPLFSQSIPEFEDKRTPPSNAWPFWKTEPLPQLPSTHHTVSYVQSISPLQADPFASFLFNSEYISVQTGTEGGESYDDDDIALGAELLRFFQVTSVVPDLQVKMANLKRTYAMLVTRPLPEYNRFPEYLIFTIHMLFEKSSRKILDEMNENYERMAPAIAKAVRQVIEKINVEMPRYLMFLTSRYSFHAARSYYGFHNEKLNQAKKRLNDHSEPVVLDMTSEMMYVYHFLESYCNVVHNDSKPAKRFFEVLGDIKNELLMNRPFAVALLLISTLADGFKEFDERFAQETRDILTLEARDKFIVKIAEKSVLVDGMESNTFIHSEAPLSMRLFFEYAVTLSTSRKDISPQKLTFATYSGCKLMSQLNTFCGLLSSLEITGEFFSLCDLYYEQLNCKFDYLGEAIDILQGRQICGISKPTSDRIVIRNVPSSRTCHLSSHYIHLYEPVPSSDETST